MIGGSFSSSPVGDDDDDKKKEGEGEGEFGEGEETIGKSSGIKLKNANGSVSSTSNSNSISPGLGAAITNPRQLSHHHRPLVGSEHRAHTATLACSLHRLRLLPWGLLRH